MEDYNKIIESLSVRFIKSKNIRILQPVNIYNYYDIENSILILNKGQVTIGDTGEVVEGKNVLFIPGGKTLNLTFGGGAMSHS